MYLLVLSAFLSDLFYVQLRSQDIHLRAIVNHSSALVISHLQPPLRCICDNYAYQMRQRGQGDVNTRELRDKGDVQQLLAVAELGGLRWLAATTLEQLRGRTYHLLCTAETKSTQKTT
ncbi:hypothetical protein BD310DRAFT_936013 [Dichomitus squalens]|uniref:Uncharacterized protein n=1 Tax=Dichomitus squalens TaxID=114155 RepID=A0A4Q9PJU5_9APHY|nr:hypothetical protein BD310DRAFT_936013 [Dichomitus squalens]